jgi:lysine 2,3-aminomutase
LQQSSFAPPASRFPVHWPPSYRRLAEAFGEDGPLLRIGRAEEAEVLPDPDEILDPTGEEALQPVPFLVRKHRARALVLTTRRCFFYCRFCFRRGSYPGAGKPAPKDWWRIFRWLSEHPEVEELILSGGDPLTLSDEQLQEIGSQVSNARGLRRWRLHTRAPVTSPRRVTAALVEALRTPLPLRLCVHTAHPAELRPEFWAAVRRLQRAGVEVLNQSVLLSGVNADPEILRELFSRLRDGGIRSHYLHHPDRAPGNAAFRLTIEEGSRVYRRLLEFPLPYVAPPYVLDLPNGAGKCAVGGLSAVAEERAEKGRRVRYRWTRPPDWDAVSAAEAYEWWDIWRRTPQSRR